MLATAAVVVPMRKRGSTLNKCLPKKVFHTKAEPKKCCLKKYVLGNNCNKKPYLKVSLKPVTQGGAEMAGGRVASFPVAGNTARGVTLAGRRIPPCPGVGSIGSTSVTNVARISEEQPGSTATTVFNTDI